MRRRDLSAAALGLAPLGWSTARAQAPDDRLTLVVLFLPGGIVDALARPTAFRRFTP